jgi:hypothetical protein
LNPFSGQEVRADGSRYHYPDEHKIDGVNNWAQSKAESKLESYQQRLARAGPDGLIHMPDGTTEFVEGGKVAGANLGYNLAQNQVERRLLSSDMFDDE